jgi:hypothetical protein
MSEKVQVKSGGIGLGGILFIVFLVLKLGVGNTAVMGWSWWWVCAPLWIPVALFLGIMVVILVFGLICAGIAAMLK